MIPKKRKITLLVSLTREGGKKKNRESKKKKQGTNHTRVEK